MTVEIVSALQAAEARSRAFRMLGDLRCEPDAELLGDATLFPLLKESLETSAPEAANDVDSLADRAAASTVEELLIAYTKLFIWPFHIPAQPYSSMYFSEPGIMTEVTVWVEQFYRNCGLEFDRSVYDLPDHIVAELEFMGHLAAVEFEALSEGNGEKSKVNRAFHAEFLDKHLLHWGPRFCDAVSRSGVSEYDSALAEVLRATLVNAESSA